jgi:hypothetical protein
LLETFLKTLNFQTLHVFSTPGKKPSEFCNHYHHLVTINFHLQNAQRNGNKFDKDGFCEEEIQTCINEEGGN